MTTLSSLIGPAMDDPFPDGMVEEIAAVLAQDGTVPAGQNLYPHVFYTKMFFPLQRMREAEQMFAKARSISPRVIMEIGADKGGSLYHWAKGFDPDMLIAAEVRGLPYDKVFSAAFPTTEFCWLPWSSYAPETVEFLKTWLGTRLIDVLFIDGDKAQFYLDFESYLPLVRYGGLVFMHDVTDAAPGKAFAQASQHPRVRAASQILDKSENFEAMAREQAGEPVTTMYEFWLRYWKGASCGVGVLEV